VGLENFDIRIDPVSRAINDAALGAAKSAPADRTAAFDALLAKVPASNPDSVKVDSYASGVPRTVVNFEGFLTAARVGSPDAIARQFLVENSGLFGLSPREVGALELTLKVNVMRKQRYLSRTTIRNDGFFLRLEPRRKRIGFSMRFEMPPHC